MGKTVRYILALAATALLPATAWADPFSIGVALNAAWQLAATVTFAQVLGVAAVAHGVFGEARSRKCRS